MRRQPKAAAPEAAVPSTEAEAPAADGSVWSAIEELEAQTLAEAPPSVRGARAGGGTTAGRRGGAGGGTNCGGAFCCAIR